MLDINPERPTSLTLRRFLFERPDMTRQKRVVTFAANAPYYLDATDISKLDAYYGLFGKVQPFMDVAARLLFKEIPVPRGSLPVSVTGIGYDLISATSPDPDQTITILLDEPEQQTLETTTTPEAIEPREFKIGDQIQIKTGVILDHNGHPVPDHTPVQFVVSTDGEEILLPKVETDDGVARIAYQIEHTGELELQAIIDPARSEILIINVPILETQPVDLTITPTPSVTPSPTETPTQIIPTPTVTPTPTPSNNQTDIGDWSLAILAASLIGWGAYRSGTILGQVRWGMRWGLSAFIGGLLVYTYISIGMPGSSVILNIAGRWGVSIAILIGSGIGWGIAAIFINGKSSNNDHS
jgi:beta-N-acetylhexosaminidase